MLSIKTKKTYSKFECCIVVTSFFSFASGTSALLALFFLFQINKPLFDKMKFQLFFLSLFSITILLFVLVLLFLLKDWKVANKEGDVINIANALYETRADRYEQCGVVTILTQYVAYNNLLFLLDMAAYTLLTLKNDKKIIKEGNYMENNKQNKKHELAYMRRLSKVIGLSGVDLHNTYDDKKNTVGNCAAITNASNDQGVAIKAMQNRVQNHLTTDHLTTDQNGQKELDMELFSLQFCSLFKKACANLNNKPAFDESASGIINMASQVHSLQENKVTEASERASAIAATSSTKINGADTSAVDKPCHGTAKS